MTIFLLVFQFGKGEQFPLQIAVAIHRGQRRQLVDYCHFQDGSLVLMHTSTCKYLIRTQSYANSPCNDEKRFRISKCSL